MQKKFSVLRFAARVFKVLGILASIFALIACGLTAAAAWAGPQMLGGGIGTGNYVDMGAAGTAAALFGAALLLAGGLIGALCLFALGELIELLIAMEENTRAAALAAVRERGPSQNA